MLRDWADLKVRMGGMAWCKAAVGGGDDVQLRSRARSPTQVEAA